MLLHFKQLFHSDCNITDGTLWNGRTGGGEVDGRGGWAAGGTLYLLLTLFGLIRMLALFGLSTYESKKCQP